MPRVRVFSQTVDEAVSDFAGRASDEHDGFAHGSESYEKGTSA